jgi:hypothetical protein
MTVYSTQHAVQGQDRWTLIDLVGEVWANLKSCTMQEILSKSVDAPLQGQEFYELRLFEKPNQLGMRHGVGWTHAEWSEMDQQVMFEGEEVEYFWILEEAKERYAQRKAALALEGFIYSDMDW